MEFKLTILERLTLLNILPRENNFINLMLIKEAAEKIGFDDKEISECEIKQTPEGVNFNAEKGKIEKPIEIGERAYSLICEVLEKLDKANKLTQEHCSIYKKFIER